MLSTPSPEIRARLGGPLVSSVRHLVYMVRDFLGGVENRCSSRAWRQPDAATGASTSPLPPAPVPPRRLVASNGAELVIYCNDITYDIGYGSTRTVESRGRIS